MANIQTTPLTFPARSQVSGNPNGVPSGFLGELLISELLGKYATLVKAGKVFHAMATVTAPVIYSTAAGTGGPLIWNKPTSGVDAHILGISFGGLSTASTVAGALGISGAAGQVIAPTATTAIDALGNALIGGPASALGGVYRVGTPTNPGTQFLPLIAVGTGAITAVEIEPSFVELGGLAIVPPGSWAAVAGSSTLTGGVLQIGLVWAELPA